MNKSSRTPDPAETIGRHVADSRDARDRWADAPLVPRPRTEEDALRIMTRIRRHAERALDPVRARRG